ncbi:uncharacterized protein LOC141630019 [Silene latifolia]|uniref:uncharacterized protein LOC141630019 n=1 Tax=Silene latifolia TaxID=37657 RepID=UPI003D785620
MVKKVWKPKGIGGPAKPVPVTKQKPVQILQRSSVQQSGVRSLEVPVVAQKSPAPVIALTPVLVQQTLVVGSSMPRRFMVKFMRTETGENRRFTHRGLSFMESLTHSLQTSRLGISTGAIERGKGSKSGDEYGLHRGGRIWLIWDPNSFKVEICDVTVQSIHASVVDKARKNKFWFTVVYGLNHAADREVLWSSLRHYHSVIFGQWLVGGDFNAKLARNERIGGARFSNAQLRPLLQVVQDCQLDDLSARGAFYTCYVHFLPKGMFDNCPCLIKFEMEVQRRGTPFKYFNMWSLVPEYFDIVQTVWNIECQGTAMYKVVTKLKGLKYKLKKLNKDQFGDIYYQLLLGSATEVKPINRRVVKAGQCLTEDHCLLLTAPITDDEVKTAMFDIPRTKAPALDGHSNQFFKNNWTIVGSDVIAAVKGAIHSGKLLKQCNATILTFIPKVELPEGDRGSVGLMLSAFDHFSKASGLVMNRGKSNFYYNGIDETLVTEIEQQTWMKRGHVPLKYLGVNVSPKRLSIMDCACLVDKIVDKNRSLGSMKLLYACRVVLIKVVLSSLHCYWARLFILPKTVIGKIEAVCRSYLWKQGWLGFKDLHTWNVGAIEKYVWWVAMKADHLLVRWVHAVYIKNSAWKDYELGSGSSWAWRKIFQVKNIYKAKLFFDTNVEHYSVKEGYHWLRPTGEKESMLTGGIFVTSSSACQQY